MGKRKSAVAKPTTRSTPKLDTIFDCPFCNHSRCVEVKLEKKRALGSLFCRICHAAYNMRISALTEPIDVYSDWLDRAEEENRPAEEPASAAAAPAGGRESGSSSVAATPETKRLRRGLESGDEEETGEPPEAVGSDEYDDGDEDLREEDEEDA